MGKVVPALIIVLIALLSLLANFWLVMDRLEMEENCKTEVGNHVDID